MGRVKKPCRKATGLSHTMHDETLRKVALRARRTASDRDPSPFEVDEEDESNARIISDLEPGETAGNII